MLKQDRISSIAIVVCALCACSKADNAGGTGGGTSTSGPTAMTGGQPGTASDTNAGTPGAASTGTGDPGRAAGGSSAPSSGAGGSAAAGSGAGMTMMNAGSGGSGATAGVAGVGAGGSEGGAAGSGAPANPSGKPPCTTKDSQVIILGDSYLNWGTHTFGADMDAAAGQMWRMYAVGGYSMGSGGIGLIPPEFDQALADDKDIKAAVMDGGGNDILIPDATWVGGANCKDEANAGSDPVCQMIIKTAFDAATKLMNHMSDSGVQDVVYIFYPHVPNGTVLGGANPNASLDYALPMAKMLCDQAVQMTSGKMRCHFLDLVPIFDGHPEYFAAADVHENSTGSAAMAKAVWKIMTDNCIAQKAGSGCCTP